MMEVVEVTRRFNKKLVEETLTIVTPDMALQKVIPSMRYWTHGDYLYGYNTKPMDPPVGHDSKQWVAVTIEVVDVETGFIPMNYWNLRKVRYFRRRRSAGVWALKWYLSAVKKTRKFE